MLLLNKPSVSINDLRRIPDTTWKAARTNFGTCAYIGNFKGKQIELISYCYLAPRFSDDDDTFETKWIPYVDGVPYTAITASVAETVSYLLQKL